MLNEPFYLSVICIKLGLISCQLFFLENYYEITLNISFFFCTVLGQMFGLWVWPFTVKWTDVNVNVIQWKKIKKNINENQKWVTSNWTSWISVFCTCAHLPVSAGLSALSPWNDSPPSGSGSLSLNAPQSAPILTEKR